MTDARRHAPATARNRDPILAVLRRVLPESGLVLEIASGSGEHAVHFARALPQLDFQPSDPDPENLASIDAWRSDAALPNLRTALALDTTRDPWPIDRAAALYCANMIHIAPWQAALGLLEGAGRVLRAGSPLVLYGPYHRSDATTAPSNERFDESLKSRDPTWGIRHLDEVTDHATSHGLRLEEIVEMPANNLTVIFRRV